MQLKSTYKLKDYESVVCFGEDILVNILVRKEGKLESKTINLLGFLSLLIRRKKFKDTATACKELEFTLIDIAPTTYVFKVDVATVTIKHYLLKLCFTRFFKPKVVATPDPEPKVVLFNDPDGTSIRILTREEYEQELNSIPIPSGPVSIFNKGAAKATAKA